MQWTPKITKEKAPFLLKTAIAVVERRNWATHVCADYFTALRDFEGSGFPHKEFQARGLPFVVQDMLRNIYDTAECIVSRQDEKS